MTSPILKFQQDISSREFLIAAALGLIPGVQSEVKFGHCPDAAGTINTDVWERGGTQAIYLFPPDAGEAMEMVSLAAGDTTQSVLVEGLDENGLPKTDTKTLNGVVPVALDGLWSSVHRICNRAVDGDSFTADCIVQTAGGAGNIYAVADDDDQQTSQAIFKVPSDKVAVIINFSNAMNKSGGPSSSTVNRLRIARKDKNFQSRVYFGLQETGTTNLSSDAVLPLVVGPWSRIKAQATPSAGPMDISAEFSLLLIDTDLLDPAFIAAL